MAGQEEQVEQDPFELAWNEATSEDNQDQAQEAAPVVNTGDTVETVSQVDPQEPSTNAPGQQEGATTPSEHPADAPTDPKEIQQERSWRGRLQKEEAALKKAREELEAQRRELADMRGNAPAPDHATTAPEDDLATLEKEVADEYGDKIAILLDKKAKAIARQELEALRNELAPVVASSQDLARSHYLSQVTAMQPDWQDHIASGALEVWYGEQPLFMQKALQEAWASPNPKDAAWVVARFKQEKGITNTHPSKAPGLSEKANHLLKTATAVPARGVNVPAKGKPDPNDYDAAWEEAERSNK